jgi:replicative superfamily II helicase
MSGRAGRKGKDEIGETYLCCQKSDLEAVAELLEAEVPSVGSFLLLEKLGIKRYKPHGVDHQDTVDQLTQPVHF